MIFAFCSYFQLIYTDENHLSKRITCDGVVDRADIQLHHIHGLGYSADIQLRHSDGVGYIADIQLRHYDGVGYSAEIPH